MLARFDAATVPALAVEMIRVALDQPAHGGEGARAGGSRCASASTSCPCRRTAAPTCTTATPDAGRFVSAADVLDGSFDAVGAQGEARARRPDGPGAAGPRDHAARRDGLRRRDPRAARRDDPRGPLPQRASSLAPRIEAAAAPGPGPRPLLPDPALQRRRARRRRSPRAWACSCSGARPPSGTPGSSSTRSCPRAGAIARLRHHAGGLARGGAAPAPAAARAGRAHGRRARRRQAHPDGAAARSARGLRGASGASDVAALLEPARTVGGDFYDCFMLDDRRLFFVVADVSGKGLPASLFMASVKSHPQERGAHGGGLRGRHPRAGAGRDPRARIRSRSS